MADCGGSTHFGLNKFVHFPRRSQPAQQVLSSFASHLHLSVSNKTKGGRERGGEGGSVYVRERERGGEGGSVYVRERERGGEGGSKCVCERERERWRGRE